MEDRHSVIAYCVVVDGQLALWAVLGMVTNAAPAWFMFWMFVVLALYGVVLVWEAE